MQNPRSQPMAFHAAWTVLLHGAADHAQRRRSGASAAAPTAVIPGRRSEPRISANLLQPGPNGRRCSIVACLLLLIRSPARWVQPQSCWRGSSSVDACRNSAVQILTTNTPARGWCSWSISAVLGAVRRWSRAASRTQCHDHARRRPLQPAARCAIASAVAPIIVHARHCSWCQR